jgi:CheY-like chemotaxis protein
MGPSIIKIFADDTQSELAKNIITWVEAEAVLDKAIADLNLYISSQTEAGDDLEKDDEYKRLRTVSENADKEWSQSYIDVLNYEPKTVKEIGQKILVSINAIKEGLEDPRLSKSIEKCAHKLVGHEEALEIKGAMREKIRKEGKTYRLCLIDDSALDRMLIKHAFLARNDSLDFFEMEEGLEVVRAIKATKPNATLLDLAMPRTNGLDILRLIRSDNDLKNHPVWIITASSDEDDKFSSLSAGADGYYVKPSTLSDYDTIASNILDTVFA